MALDLAEFEETEGALFKDPSQPDREAPQRLAALLAKIEANDTRGPSDVIGQELFGGIFGGQF